jgi:hypothetical protein
MMAVSVTPAVLAPPPSPPKHPAAQPRQPSSELGSDARRAGRRGNPKALLIAVVLFGAAGYWFWVSSQKTNGWAKAMGEVAGLHPGRFGRYATVQFTAENGLRYQIVDSSQDTAVGQKVTVLYPPENPNWGQLDSDYSLFIGPIILATIACGCVGLWRMPIFRGAPEPCQGDTYSSGGPGAAAP